MNTQVLVVAAVIAALLMGCGQTISPGKESNASKVLSAAPLMPLSEPFYKDSDYILDATATVKTETVEASVASLASSVKLDPTKTYKVEIKIFESK